MTRREAEDMAYTVYGSTAPAVVELLLLTDSKDRVERYRALRALEWFDQSVTDEPAAAVEDARPDHVAAFADAVRDVAEWAIRCSGRAERLRLSSLLSALLIEAERIRSPLAAAS